MWVAGFGWTAAVNVSLSVSQQSSHYKSFGLSENPQQDSPSVAPQKSNPPFHEPLAVSESPICHNVNSPPRLVIQVKGESMIHVGLFIYLFFSCFDGK